MTRHHLASVDDRIVRALRAGEMTAPELKMRLGMDPKEALIRLLRSGRIGMKREYGNTGTRIVRLVR